MGKFMYYSTVSLNGGYLVILLAFLKFFPSVCLIAFIILVGHCSLIINFNYNHV